MKGGTHSDWDHTYCACAKRFACNKIGRIPLSTALPLALRRETCVLSTDPSSRVLPADMAGLRKAKKYDWKDSNLALFGSDTEKNVSPFRVDHAQSKFTAIFHCCMQVKKASAETEPAWKGAGSKVGMQIWRIVKFKVSLGG